VADLGSFESFFDDVSETYFSTDLPRSQLGGAGGFATFLDGYDISTLDYLESAHAWETSTPLDGHDLGSFVLMVGNGGINDAQLSQLQPSWYKMRAWRPGVASFETWTATWPSPANPSGQPYVDLTIVAIKRPSDLVGS
jgi:hypothetical protein